MTFDLISGLHMQIQTWHPPLWLCTHAKYYVKSGLTNVLKNANKTKNMHLFSIRIANYQPFFLTANKKGRCKSKFLARYCVCMCTVDTVHVHRLKGARMENLLQCVDSVFPLATICGEH